MCKLKEQAGASKNLFKQRTEKVAKRLSLMNSRYEALEKRRCLEIEGYKNDIKLLRQRLKDVEKQLFKVTKINFLCELQRLKLAPIHYILLTTIMHTCSF